MPMDANEIERLIKSRIPDAAVSIRDLAGDGDHYAATVISKSFRGKSRVQQHQFVYEALKDRWAARCMRWRCRPGYRVHKHDPEKPAQDHASGENMSIQQFIDNEVKSNDVVLFMKGTPQFPQCGFSGQVVQILDHLGVLTKASTSWSPTRSAKASRPMRNGRPFLSSM